MAGQRLAVDLIARCANLPSAIIESGAEESAFPDASDGITPVARPAVAHTHPPEDPPQAVPSVRRWPSVGTVMHRLDVVPIRVVDEGRIVASVILGPDSRTMFLSASRCRGCSEEGVNRLSILGHEGYVRSCRRSLARFPQVHSEVIRSLHPEGQTILLFVNNEEPSGSRAALKKARLAPRSLTTKRTWSTTRVRTTAMADPLPGNGRASLAKQPPGLTERECGRVHLPPGASALVRAPEH
jgi:hypothetical protein